MRIEPSMLPVAWLLVVTALAHLGACAGKEATGGEGGMGGGGMSYPCCAQPADTMDCRQSKAYQCFCHLVASESIAAVAEGRLDGTVNQFPDDECLFPWASFETMHGDTAATMLAGVWVCPVLANKEIVDVLVPIRPDHEPWYSYALPVTQDDRIVLPCGAPAPALKKDDAITALLAQKEPSKDAAACVAYLASIDPTWGEASCLSQ